MGVDVKKNKYAQPIVAGRQGKWLTEQEERDIRNKSINYSLGAMDRQLPFWVKGKMTPEMEAMVAGAVYRGEGNSLWNTNSTLGEAF